MLIDCEPLQNSPLCFGMLLTHRPDLGILYDRRTVGVHQSRREAYLVDPLWAGARRALPLRSRRAGSGCELGRPLRQANDNRRHVRPAQTDGSSRSTGQPGR